ncbi:hypothetical protein [Cohnella silvisoli]|uniref:DNA-binding response regulator n=1 Tax=Cohnella silvisoli TaxID=2873699 RepID=A0ABV1KN66_9BACL|nr:hypothetical protein [Cohnella silvisoli]MCD9021192.1 hypothetical protein [Cohnella silvisoli]
MYKSEYTKLLEEQKRQATGMRLEMLLKQGEGERKLCEEILTPTLKTLKGIVLEKEIITLTGVKAYIDAYYEPLRFGFEGEGFVAHAENITRPRFDFERQKIRSMVALGIKYVPFSWDDMDKKPDMCRRTVFELLGRFSGNMGVSYREVSLYEREVIRYALWLDRPIRMSDVRECLQKGPETCRGVLREMVDKRLLKPLHDGLMRNHEYVLEEDASKHLW